MKKPSQTYDMINPGSDYKTAAIMRCDREKYESPNIWLYVGADSWNPNYAKVGITMGDLRSRSYSSANPHYYVFCAFQCNPGTTKLQLEQIESCALTYLDRVFPNHRERHMESNVLSECYYHINFEEFFVCLHNYLYDNHYTNFQTTSFENNVGVEEGYALLWQFNPRLQLDVQKHFLYLILRD